MHGRVNELECRKSEHTTAIPINFQTKHILHKTTWEPFTSNKQLQIIYINLQETNHIMKMYHFFKIVQHEFITLKIHSL